MKREGQNEKIDQDTVSPSISYTLGGKNNIGKEKKGRGCFFRGCMGCLGFGVLIFILSFVGIWFGYSKIVGRTIDWTDDAPLTFPERTVPKNAKKIVENTEKMIELMDNGKESSFVLNQDIINAFLSEKKFSDYVDIDLGTGNIATLIISAPLDYLNWEKAQGRYLNMILGISYTYNKGGTEAYIHRFEIPGKTINPDLLIKLKGTNLGPYFYRDEDYMKNIKKFESIVLSGGKLHIKMKQ